MLKIKYITAFVFLFFSCINAQSDRPELTSYLPLQIGNVWNYGWFEIDHVSYISDTIMVSDTVYYAYRDSAITPIPYTSRKYIRWDSTGYLKYQDNRIWIDFTQAVGDTLIVYVDDSDSSFYFHKIILSDTSIIITPAGTFDSCLVVLFDSPIAVDDAAIYCFAPNVGIVYFLLDIHPSQQVSLLSAIVNGQILSVDEPELVNNYILLDNYPNPFNPTTTIQYELSQRSDIQITIYDLLGRKVTTIVSEIQEAGYKSVIWDATNSNGQPVSAGVYLYRIKAGDFVQTKKMILLK